MKRICTICARGGSKGVPGKNTRLLNGRPLIVHSLEQARASGLFDLVAVSSDSAEILEIAQAAGADFTIERPSALASDTAAKLPVIRHAVECAEAATETEYEVIVDLDATSPLRHVADIQGAVRLFEECGGGNVITGAPARRSPYFNLVELGEDGRVRLAKTAERPIVRRQDAPKCFDMNASIYVWSRSSLFDLAATVIGHDTFLYEMPEDRSFDIDSEVDFEIVEFLMKRRTAQ